MFDDSHVSCFSGDNQDTVSSWVKKPAQVSNWQQSTTKPTTRPASAWESPTPKIISQQWEQQQPTEKPTWTQSTASPSSPTSKWATDWVQPYSPVPKAWQKRELDKGKFSRVYWYFKISSTFHVFILFHLMSIETRVQ